MAGKLQKIAKSAERCTRIVTNFLALSAPVSAGAPAHAAEPARRRPGGAARYSLRIDNVEVIRRSPPICRSSGPIPSDPAGHRERADERPQRSAACRTRRRLVLTTRYERTSGRIVLEVRGQRARCSGGHQRSDLRSVLHDEGARAGTGLGLSLCRGIIDSHDGVFSTRDDTGGGATFVIELAGRSAAGPTTRSGRGRARSARPARRSWSWTTSPTSRELLCEALLLDGHRVDTANNGAAALNRLRDRSYDLVFSDMKMPGMSGVEL